jgi:hexosaminidase
LPIEKLYSYDPNPGGLSAAQEERILGAQANVWTEYISTQEALDYMVFPREAAMAEIVWAPKGSKNWTDFVSRLGGHLKRLDALKVNYSKAVFDVTATTDFNDKGQLQVRLKTPDDVKKLFYTLDGTAPTEKSSEYEKPITLLKTTKIKANTPTGRLFEQTFYVHKASGKKYTLNTPPNENYAEKEFALTDGQLGTSPEARQNFVRFDKDLELTIDLGDVMPVGKITMNFLKIIADGSYPPSKIEVTVSKDDKEYKEVAMLPLSYDTNGSWQLEHVDLQLKSQRCKYVRIKAKNVIGQWMALDEIVIE